MVKLGKKYTKPERVRLLVWRLAVESGPPGDGHKTGGFGVSPA